jgi:cysteine desulfurase
MDAARELYLDHNATAPLCDEARAAMHAALDAGLVNPSSLHVAGERARRAQDDARAAVAALLGAADEELVFTSGGTEANHLALHGQLPSDPRGSHLVVPAIEHASTLAAAAQLESRGARVTTVAPRADGTTAVDALLAAIAPDTRLVVCMAANNETGVVQPLAPLAAALAPRRVALHVDAVQLLGKQPLRVADLGATTASFSAHKIGGPAGVGALWIRPGTRVAPLIGGGRQERGRRGGTAALLALIGFAAAATAARLRLARSPSRSDARDAFETRLAAIRPDARFVGAGSPRLANTSLVVLPGHDGRALAQSLSRRGVCVATGSACQSGATEPSHVLRAMGLPAAAARGALRFSFAPDADVPLGTAAADHLVAVLRAAPTDRAS